MKSLARILNLKNFLLINAGHWFEFLNFWIFESVSGWAALKIREQIGKIDKFKSIWAAPTWFHEFPIPNCFVCIFVIVVSSEQSDYLILNLMNYKYFCKGKGDFRDLCFIIFFEISNHFSFSLLIHLRGAHLSTTQWSIYKWV